MLYAEKVALAEIKPTQVQKQILQSFQGFIDYLETIDLLGYEINLFRGQSSNYYLLPSIARKNPDKDTTELEMKMLEDLKRRSTLLINRDFKTDWEWLVFAQHFGLKTRLLDWTSNPLIALWFACSNEAKLNLSSFVYVLSTDKSMLVDVNKSGSPFQNRSTKVLRPSLNNERIIAQSGWFTAHRYSATAKRFVTLETHNKTKNMITEIEVLAKLKKEALHKLSIFGVNSRTIFPDISGLCMHMNWKYDA